MIFYAYLPKSDVLLVLHKSKDKNSVSSSLSSFFVLFKIFASQEESMQSKRSHQIFLSYLLIEVCWIILTYVYDEFCIRCHLYS